MKNNGEVNVGQLRMLDLSFCVQRSVLGSYEKQWRSESCVMKNNGEVVYLDLQL